MSETKDTKAPVDNAGQGQEQMVAQDMPVTIHAQYVRDLSFENPNAPESLRPSSDAPEMDINIGMDARKLEDDTLDNLFEVVLNVRAAAERKGDASFIAELQYGVTVSIDTKVPEDNHHPLLLIEIPRMAFPFVRQIISDLTVQGGFPPLLLNPVDFHALYMSRFGAEIEQAQKDAAAAATN
ncbi:MAG: protein-export chaperone SecB [Bdellovibrionales bacterium]